MSLAFPVNRLPTVQAASAHLVIVGQGGVAETILAGWLSQTGIAVIDQVWLRAAPRISIDQVRNFARELLLQPVAGRIRIGLIPEAHLLLVEAGHALLKLLEDPPAHVMIVLACEREDQMLPTIISRCQRWYIGKSQIPIPKSQVTISLDAVRRMSYRERLKLAEVWAKEDDWRDYLHGLLRDAQDQLRRGELSAKVVDRLLRYENLLGTNVTPRLLLENCLLALPKAVA